MERGDAAERALAEAYTAGVNAGLAALGEKPFEYHILRATPRPWRAEDCGLVGFAMTLDLQNDVAGHERMTATLRDTLGAEGLAFFAPLMKPRDAALDGSTGQLKVPSARLPVRSSKASTISATIDVAEMIDTTPAVLAATMKAMKRLVDSAEPVCGHHPTR